LEKGTKSLNLIIFSIIYCSYFHYSIFFNFCQEILEQMSYNAGLLAAVCQPGQGLAEQDQGWQTVGGAWHGSERSDRPSHAEP
jgi:hypothetical protein